MKSDRPTVPTSDAAKPVLPVMPGDVVVDFATYRKWILKDAATLDVVEKVVGYE